MNNERSTNRKFKRMVANILSIVAILAMAFLAMRSASAQETALPEGWHDGVGGSVNAAGCGAFGWAVDPDDRDRDLQVRILADGNPVATTTADLLRPDVGACTGGTCGFGVNLWGLISAGEEHQITAQAFDEETSTWVDLSGTPKSVTCWGYPEGFHDGTEGTVDANSCTAFGWAVDPDNRDRDVQVRILSDGEQVATVAASDYGQDMEQNGICPGGTCRFSVNLWGLISPDEEHQITVQAFDQETDVWMNLEATPKLLTCQTPPPPNPFFRAFPDGNAVDGGNWPLGATVHMAIDDPATVDDPDYVDDATVVASDEGWISTYVRFDFDGLYDLKRGDKVTLTAGEISRYQVVPNLWVTTLDVENNIVGGTFKGADAGTTVHVFIGDGAELYVSTDSDGSWVADFDEVGFDLLPGMQGGVEVWFDEFNDSTIFDWNVPWLIAFPENDAVEAWEWPVGTAVTLTINNAPSGFERTGTAQVTILGDPRTYVRFDFADAYDLKIGDVVTLTDGKITRTHMVQNLSVTDVNADADTVRGTANAGVIVRLWPHGHDQIATLQITTGDDGTWVADFTSVGFNLVPGIGGRSEVGDEAGNWTAVDWSVPMDGWQQVNVSGFGDSLTTGVTALEVFKGQLYAGASNWDTGGQVWSLGQNGQWFKVSDAGFGSGSANPVIIDLAVFQGQLYAGTGWNNEAPGQVWRSSDGIKWQPVTTNGFGKAENIAVTNFVAFNDALYAGTGSTSSSAQIWRSSTGKSGSWKQVAPDGSGLAGNVTDFAVYKQVLYAAIEPAGGLGGPIQVWRSINGGDWVTVTTDGFGDEHNESTGGFAQFGGYLYLGTQNKETGAQLWRTKDGILWKKVVGDGFGDLNNIKIESLRVYDDLLYAATYNPPMGLQLWRSADGMNWEQVTANGFGDSGNLATLWNNATVEFQGQILIGTWNYAEGGELWMFTP